MKSFFQQIFTKFLGWLDPKLDAFRPKQPPYTPKTEKELMNLLKRTPTSILTAKERETIAAVMSLKTRKVRDLMMSADKITYVDERDVLGPLMLDCLYKSGFAHFPVRNSRKEIVGLLHTAALNSLKIKQTDCAKSYLDPHVYYLRDDYTLEQALAAFLRTNCYFFLVVNKKSELIGLLTYEMLTTYLLADTPTDDFDRDDDRQSVANR